MTETLSRVDLTRSPLEETFYTRPAHNCHLTLTTNALSGMQCTASKALACCSAPARLARLISVQLHPTHVRSKKSCLDRPIQSSDIATVCQILSSSCPSLETPSSISTNRVLLCYYVTRKLRISRRRFPKRHASAPDPFACDNSHLLLFACSTSLLGEGRSYMHSDMNRLPCLVQNI
jgi:hypothetical protein